MNTGRIEIVFVCLGNICRSPTAEGVFRATVEKAGLSDRISVRSAGTADYHVGEPPDSRSIRHARARGYEIAHQRARQFRAADFVAATLVLAMDSTNLQSLKRLCPPEHAAKLRLFLDFAPEEGTRDVPDPYYGDSAGFERVIDLCEAGASGLLQSLSEKTKAA